MNKGRLDRRRRHSAEMKARVLSACNEPGASIAQVALENGLNTNLVHKWRLKARAIAGPGTSSVPVTPVNDFVPVPILPDRDIRIAIRSRATTVEVHWPISGANACAQWLREWLR